MNKCYNENGDSMDIIDKAVDAFRSKETVFYKTDSDIQDKYNALERLNHEYPNNQELQEELFIVKKGLDGENELSYELSKANIGMYVLRDIKVKYKDLTAQIDYVVITPVFTYYIECKNLVGDITVNDKGDFIRELSINGRKIRKGMYSPLRQVESQREVLKKIWNSKAGNFTKFFASSHFEEYRKVLVVAANHDTILNTQYAPKEMKYQVLKSDSLVRQLQYDYEHNIERATMTTKKDMEKNAETYIHISMNEKVNFYEYYKNKYCKKEEVKDNNLKDKLIIFRTTRSKEMNIPAYYVFTNEELDKIVEIKPKTIEELENNNILSPIKIKTHGEEIIEEINKYNENNE